MLEYCEENAAGIPQVFSNNSSQLPESCSPATGTPTSSNNSQLPPALPNLLTFLRLSTAPPPANDQSESVKRAGWGGPSLAV